MALHLNIVKCNIKPVNPKNGPLSPEGNLDRSKLLKGVCLKNEVKILDYKKSFFSIDFTYKNRKTLQINEVFKIIFGDLRILNPIHS